MSRRDREIEQMVERAAQGMPGVLDRLLELNRPRLRKMIAVQLDTRLQARVDPSDVVQETLFQAVRRFGDYLRDRQMPFYPWLRQLAIDQISRLRRDHVKRVRRSVQREVSIGQLLPDESLHELAGCLSYQGSSPTQRLSRKDVQAQVRAALDRLATEDREILVLRCLEHMSAAEAAAVLGISQPAVRMRQMRALQRLEKLLRQSGDHPADRGRPS